MTSQEDDNSSNNKEEESKKEDDEGLLPAYDVILCGTGLVQSILASALCRAGQSVLHCDGDEYYGELNAVTTFSGLEDMVHQWKINTTSQKKAKNATESSDSIPLLSASSNRVVLHSTSKASIPEFSEKIQVGSQVQTSYGIGKVVSLPNPEKGISMAVRLEKDASKDDEDDNNADEDINNRNDDVHQNPVVYVGSTTVSLVEDPSIVATREILYNPYHVRSFALDLHPGLLFASGKAVKGLLTSNVAEYLEFKSVEGLTWLSQDLAKKNKKQTDAPASPKWQLSRVPCSKGDVFGTKLLAPMDKRRLMKFLQLTLDYATSVDTKAELEAYAAADAAAAKEAEEKEDTKQTGDTNTHKMDTSTPHNDDTPAETAATTTTTTTTSTEEDVKSLNERMLQQGRSLARPQNKAVATNDLKVLEDCIQTNIDFETFLVQKQRLSPTLVKLVRHALALEISSQSTSTVEGMTQLCHHVQALGRYGTTAFLYPLYGSGELSQSFCRSAAVHGGTYLLRRSAKKVVLNQKEGDNSVRGIILAGEEATSEDEEQGQPNIVDKTIMSKHVVIAGEAIIGGGAITPIYKQQRILRRISILKGKLCMNDEKEENHSDQRHVILIPPHAVGNNPYAIHGVTLDSSVNVAPSVPEYGGCTVLHLTTTVDDDDNTAVKNSDNGESDKGDVNESADATIMENAIKALLEATSSSHHVSQGNSNEEEKDATFEELYHATFSYPITSNTSEIKKPSSMPNGLHVCHYGEQNLAVDAAFEQAKEIFKSICPNAEFLELSAKMDSEIKERLGDVVEEDEEGMVLESAMNMLDVSKKEKTKGDGEDDEEQSSIDQENKITTGEEVSDIST